MNFGESMCESSPRTLSQRNSSIHDRAKEKRDRLESELAAVNKLIAQIELHPEIEAMMTALIAAGL